MENPMLLTSGEFARMCNVSRELLIHYDKIDLLKPKEIKENGYRYYSLEQLYLFDGIRFFIDAGVPIKEVKEYFDNRSTELFLERIQEIIERMKQQQAILEGRIGMMEKMHHITRRALLFPKGEPRLSFWEELALIVTDIAEDSIASYEQALSKHSDFCRNVAHVSCFPMGRIVEIPDPAKPAERVYRKLQTWVSVPEDSTHLDDRLLIKPRGNYAVILHQGGRNTLENSYTRLFTFLKKERYTTLGPVYELDMNSYLMSNSADDYLIHVSVLVKEKA